MRPKRSERKRGQAAAPEASGVPAIAGYRDLTVIGRGASATVYRATQENFGRTVAIKVLHVDVSDRRAQRRFEREREINGRLSHHPNVVTVLESGFVDGRYPYLAMEFFEHGSLSGRLGERGPFDISDALHIGIRIAGALESAHGMGVLHRDVKPQNILLSRFGEPALADFGIATILELEQSMTAGLTPVHAAPEILEGSDPSPSSDVYALGSTVYTLLSGAPPFAGPPGEGVLAQLLRITTMDLPAMGRPDVPPSLVLALREATAKRPEERTPTAAAFGRLLQMVQDDVGLSRTTLPLDVPADVPAPPRPQPVERPHPVTPAPPTWLPPPPSESAAPGDAPNREASGPTAPVPPSPPATVPSSLPASVAADTGDLTLGDDIDSETTVSARQLHPFEPESRRSRRWVAVVAVSAAAVVAGAVAAGAYMSGRQWDGEVAIDAEGTGAGTVGSAETTDAATTDEQATEPDESSAASPVESIARTVPNDPEDWAPQNVVLSTTGDITVIRWTDASDGVALHVIDADPRPPGWTPAVTQPGRDFAVLDVEPDVEACFQVRAVLAVGAPTSAGAGFAVGHPNWVCLPGASPPTTG